MVSQCTCQLLKKIIDFQVEEKLMQFLLSLNDSFDNVITYILSVDPLQSINKAYYLAQQVKKPKEIIVLNHSTQ